MPETRGLRPGDPGYGPESHWIPAHWPLSAWFEHAPFAAWLVAAARPERIVELGSHLGFSLFAFAEAARRLELDTRITAIDSWEGDDHAGFYGDDVYESVREVAEREYPDLIELRRGYFSAVADQIEDGTVDLLHIDGRHGYEDVKEDYELYLPKLSARGVVLFHDVAERQEGFGVHRLWDEIADSAPSFLFEHGHGLGVLAAGPAAPPAVLGFIEAANREPQRFRDGYFELGKVIDRQYILEVDYPALLTEQATRIQQDERQLVELEQRAGSAEAQLAAVLDSRRWRAFQRIDRVRARLHHS